MVDKLYWKSIAKSFTKMIVGPVSGSGYARFNPMKKHKLLNSFVEAGVCITGKFGAVGFFGFIVAAYREVKPLFSDQAPRQSDINVTYLTIL